MEIKTKWRGNKRMEIVKLYPECKDNIWGGVKLRDKYGKQTDK